MDTQLVITADERKRLVAGHQRDFPTYTTQLINIANQNSGATKPENIGPMTEIIEEFNDEHPDGRYEDWVEYYTDLYAGEAHIQDAADKTYDMVERMREAMELIDREMVERWVRELVLYQTYTGHDIREAILQKLAAEFQTDIEFRLGEDEQDDVDALLDDRPIRIQPMSSDRYPATASSSDVSTVYYEERSSGGIVVELQEMTATLDDFDD